MRVFVAVVIAAAALAVAAFAATNKTASTCPTDNGRTRLIQGCEGDTPAWALPVAAAAAAIGVVGAVGVLTVR